MSDIKYNRPNENWECGWKQRGFQCHVGPTTNGKCSRKGECAPVKKDDGYHCTRQPQHGGKCHQGPLPNGTCSKQYPPCNPKRSIRAKRGLTTLCLSVLALAVIFFNLGSTPSGTSFFSPGSLSFKHSSIVNNCAICHTGSHGSPLNWIVGAGVGQQDSQNCLGCHKMGENPQKPHSLASSTLSEITQRISGGKVHSSEIKDINCNTCHSEHKGADFDLTKMTKKQCQTCHAEKFESLKHGHPEFVNYPADKRVNILFDHTEHFNKHFPEKGGEKISCNTCHAPSSTGSEMVLNGFERSCSQCHSEQIYGDSAIEKGVVFLRLPTLDLDTIKSKRLRIGSWPADTDGTMTPFMMSLLSTKDEFKSLIQEIRDEEISLDDLSELEDEQLKTVENLVWEIKSLIQQLGTDGVEGLKERIERIYGKELSRKQIANLSAAMPVDVFRAAGKTWFQSKLPQEIEAFGDGEKARTRPLSAPEEENEDEDKMIAGGWYKNNFSFNVKYRPTGHGDKFVRGWLTLAGKTSEKMAGSEHIFKVLSHRKESPGSCTKCHGVVKSKDDYKVHWMGRLEKVGAQGFVRFSHSSHLNLLKEEGCYTCHKVNPKAEFNKAYKGFDPSVFESNFYSLKKSTCVRCHQEGQVKDNCLTCHNYHIGDFFSSEECMKGIHTKMSEEEAEE